MGSTPDGRLANDFGDMKLVWVESDVVKGTCFDLDAPTLLTLPEWLGALR